jgi:vacuolar-type H+-ATPase subunit B/Vma2
MPLFKNIKALDKSVVMMTFAESLTIAKRVIVTAVMMTFAESLTIAKRIIVTIENAERTTFAESLTIAKRIIVTAENVIDLARKKGWQLGAVSLEVSRFLII